MLPYNTLKSRKFRVRQLLKKYATDLSHHNIRLYFGDMSTGQLSNKPTSAGYVKLMQSGAARYQYGLSNTPTGKAVSVDNDIIIGIKDLTLNVIVYHNPLTRKLNYRL